MMAISGVTPNEHPISGIGAALLGTLVGGGIDSWQPNLPIWIEIPGSADRTLDVVLNLTTAITAANAFAYNVGLRA